MAVSNKGANMAKKKYYQDASRGIEKKMNSSQAKKTMVNNDRYAGMDSRRYMEMRDAGMISEDHSQVANLPQEVMMKEYPKTDYFTYDLNDDIRGIDVQMNDDVRKERRKSGMSYPEKY